MRLLVYNIRYSTGTGLRFHIPFPGFGYLRTKRSVLKNICRFIHDTNPDIIGLLEVDIGSVRAGRVDQAAAIADMMGGYRIAGQCKYAPESVPHRTPVLSKQANALLTREEVEQERFHYLRSGVKRLIIELELPQFVILLVHLSVKYRQRREQLVEIARLVRGSEKPVLLAGDFNPLRGSGELTHFIKGTGLKSANIQRQPSWPSRNPRRELDFILYGPGIEIDRFWIPQVRYSDHLPLVCDFSLLEEHEFQPLDTTEAA